MAEQGRETAAEVYGRLIGEYGTARRQEREGLASLIQTMLSANTNDDNSGRAYDTLMDRFDGDWDRIRRAAPDQVKDAIRVAGMYHQKGPHIQQTLQRLKEERGVYDIQHVAEMPVAEGLAYLTGFPGVGHKTASIVLLFCFGKGAFPVDTHVQRITRRLGLAAAGAGTAKVKQIWEDLMPPETYFPLHMALIRHGRQVCRARSPLCGQCVLRSLCAFAADGSA